MTGHNVREKTFVMPPLLRNTFSHDYWTAGVQDGGSESVELNICMPTGVLILLNVSRNATLQEVKEDLWEEAVGYPLHAMLHDMSMYVFSCLTAMAETDELLDENKRLCDVRPFCCILKVIEKRDDKADKNLNSAISNLIGKGLHEFDSLKNIEVNDFRWKMRLLGEEVTKGHQQRSWIDRLRYQFPPRLAASDKIPQTVSSRLREGSFVLLTKFENNEISFTFNVPYTITPHLLLVSILNKKAITMNTRGDHPSDYILKVCGQEEYLIGDYPLIQFLYIQEALAKGSVPTIVTMSTNSLPFAADNIYECPDDLRSRSSSSTLTLRKKNKHVSAWSVQQSFQLTVSAICRLNCDKEKEVAIQVGMFHGGKSLCEPKKTNSCIVTTDGPETVKCEWEQSLKFDLEVRNIPRMAKLCFAIYEISKSAKGLRSRRLKDTNKELYMNPLAWANTMVYDYKNQLRSGPVTLYMWTEAEDSQSEDLLRPLHTVASNPDVDQCTALTLCFHTYSKDNTVMYPSPEAAHRYAEQLQQDETRLPPREPQDVAGGKLEQLQLMAQADPVQDMHEQDRKDIWELRRYCQLHVPGLLPRLLHCVEWNDHRDVAEVGLLLHAWPRLPAVRALELLDYAYADQTVRKFAVQCLQDMSDDELSLYLLQLVQALKHEAYLYCDLVEFLLRRALFNQTIGHYLFWHLRSEMRMPTVSIRFGLILEAYCRGSQEHIPILQRQMLCLEKFKGISDIVKLGSKDKARLAIQEYFNATHVSEGITNVLSPLNPKFRCRNVIASKCRVMDSKMRPLWLVFENWDCYGDEINVILKFGDDLRQDMLTLQMLRIMDKLWKQEGYDFRMNPYGCISMDHRVGMIEVVLNAETIANIQKEKGMFSATSAFKKGSLLDWLKDHNTTEDSLNKAIEDFTLSCAGYCVATYVLGVADRHSDNIMVKKTGQLFHIDFGHILGHFKEKFGFRRERVPFVLTHDFVHVINKGQTYKGQTKEALEFQIFQKHCETAFLILRRHGSLIISLFAMMISTGLPELSCEKDLNYLRDTLVLDLSESDAQAHFRSKFEEALGNSWKTSLNWATHNWSKNNKQ